MDRTVGWNSEWCRITIDEFRETKPPHRMRVKASRPTIRRSLARLVKDGYLGRRGRRGDRVGYSYTLNQARDGELILGPDEEAPDHDNCPPGFTNEENNVVDLPKRRRDKNEPHMSMGPRYIDQRDPGRCVNETPLLTVTGNRNNKLQQSRSATAASL